jgi:chemotaxis signal transduction protein
MATASLSGAPTRANELRYGFELAGLRLVPASGVLTEMVAEARVFPVPKGASALVGTMNLRGTIVPVFDPARLDRPRTDVRPGQHRVLVFDREEQRLGLVLDTQPELVNLVAQPKAPAPQGPLAPFFRRAWSRSEQPAQLWWEIDHRAAFEFLARGDAAQVSVQPATVAEHIVPVTEEVIQ